ncbi:Kinase [Hexamita inflata]|uniref:dual-specificity kinase n=1 Tax=Hexamita inflata TaxID=28002 RepID=A0AA86TID9_9EUKA|nr:CMGC DYRK [Hexamita inflata]
MQNKFRRYVAAKQPEKPKSNSIAQPQSKPYQGPGLKLGAAYMSPNRHRIFNVTQPNMPQTVVQNVQSPQFILQNFSHQLMEYEKEEILKFETVYYFGSKAQKTYDPMQPNYGYDDKEGDYNPVVGDHIFYRYELQKLLGQGSFGKVYRAFDHKHKRLVALKMLKNKKKFRKQGFVEIQLLEKLRQSDPENKNACITLLNRGEFRNHLFMVFDILSMDLYAYLAKNDLKGLPIQQIKEFSVQCVKALAYSFKLNIIHADIKPENILLEREGSNAIQVIDWGSGAMVGQTLYQYIQSRFYRAPEVIMGMPYSTEIDTWSMGCVFFELFTGYPIFQGENEFDQIGKIVEVLGIPPRTFVERAPRKKEFFWDASESTVKLRTNHKASTRKIDQMLRGSPKEFAEVVSRMLQWEPSERITMEDLKGLKFFEGIAWE